MPRNPNIATLKMFARQGKYTHVRPYHNDPCVLVLHSLDACEACGCALQAPNAVNVHGYNAKHAVLAGLVISEAELDEGGWSDKVGGTACSECC